MNAVASFLRWNRLWMVRLALRRAKFVEQCEVMGGDAHASPVTRELLSVAAARSWIALGDLSRAEHCLNVVRDRSDLPEVLLLQTCCDLRSGRCNDPVDLMDRMDLLNDLPPCPRTALTQAETHYHHARALTIDATGTWSTVESLASLTLRDASGPEGFDAWLLRAVALVMHRAWRRSGQRRGRGGLQLSPSPPNGYTIP